MTPEQGRAVATRMGATYMECSAKEMSGVHEIFEKAITVAVGGDYVEPRQEKTTIKSQPDVKRRKNPKSCTIL